jgi:hypothetical protein
LHFGLGNGEKIENVDVRWSDGTTQTLDKIEPNRILTVTQNKGVTASVNINAR